MSKNTVDADALKLDLINLLEDEDVLNSIRGALCRVLGCAAPVVQGGHDASQNDQKGGDDPCRDTEKRLREAEGELARSRQQVAQRDQDLSKLNDRVTQAEQKTRDVETERDKARNDNAALQKRSVLSPELARVLAHVRSDEELAERFELNAAPIVDDLTLLVQTVSVLSRSSSLNDLWEFYRTRCENMGAKLDAEDMAVFKAALGWLNENWPKKPYEFFNPPIGTIHSADAHILANGNKNAAITSVWLPGVPELKLKPLVATV